MTKVMIALEKTVLDRLWLSRRNDGENWSQIVEQLLPDNSVAARKPVTRTRVGAACQVEILGERRTCATAMDALVWCLQTLAQLDARLLERVARAVKSRTRNHIARSKTEIYPKRPDLAANARLIADGWYVGTNISNRDKQRIIQKACAVAGLKFGIDVKWLTSL